MGFSPSSLVPAGAGASGERIDERRFSTYTTRMRSRQPANIDLPVSADFEEGGPDVCDRGGALSQAAGRGSQGRRGPPGLPAGPEEEGLAPGLGSAAGRTASRRRTSFMIP